jgi:hypothetical protein
MVQVMLFLTISVLYFYVSTFRIVGAVANMAVFCCFFTSFPPSLYRHFLNDFQIVTITLIITSTMFAFTQNIYCIVIVRPSYFEIFSGYFLVTLLSLKMAVSINRESCFSLLGVNPTTNCFYVIKKSSTSEELRTDKKKFVSFKNS